MPRLLAERAQEFGDKPYVRFMHEADQTVTYGSLFTEAEHAGSRLRAEFKLKPGTVTALLLPNGRDFVRCWATSLFAGLVDVAINYEFKKTTLLFGLSTVGAEVVFTDASGIDRLLDPDLHDYLPTLKAVVLVGSSDADEAHRRLAEHGGSAPVIPLEELLQPGPKRRFWEGVESFSLASIRYTSGTTGNAKGIMYSHIFMLNRTAVHNEVFTLQHEDTLYSPFPMYHALSGVMATVGTLVEGTTMVSSRRFSASSFWPDIRAVDASLAHILFPLIPMLLKQPPGPEDRQHRVRYLYTAWPHREFEERFNTKLIQVFAQSEVGVIAYRRGGSEEMGRNVGKPLPEMNVQIVDDADRPLPTGTPGEIVIRPAIPHRVMLGYYNNFTATARAFRNIWHHTGDQGILDENGELHFLGRLGDTIRRRGVNISADQIDEEIVRHPDILECAVIGVPSELGEEDIKACIVWRNKPADTDKAIAGLIAFMESRLPRQYVPRYVELADSLPRTNTGKFRKVELKNRTATGPVWDRETNKWSPQAA